MCNIWPPNISLQFCRASIVSFVDGFKLSRHGAEVEQEDAILSKAFNCKLSGFSKPPLSPINPMNHEPPSTSLHVLP